MDHPHAPNRFAVLSTPARVASPHDLAGRGVTIALLDSGFTPHPDLTQPENRIVAYHDVHDPERGLDTARPPEPDEWHGTQTAVVAAGNGFLSDGAYRGLASQARLVLVRVGREGRVTEESIEKGLLWVLENAERYGIRVVSMSLGGDAERPLGECPLNQLAEEAVRRGLVLVAAAGNSAYGECHRCLPPASAPSVIAVGGYDDGNDPERKNLALYCSSFGVTPDGVVKPELIAPAAWVAAPILPGTEAERTAEALSGLAAAPDERMVETLLEAGLEEVAAAAAGERSPPTRSARPPRRSSGRRRSWRRTTSTWTARRSRLRSRPPWSPRCSRPTPASRRRTCGGSCSGPRSRLAESRRSARVSEF